MNTWTVQIFDEDGELIEECGFFKTKEEAELELLKLEEGGIHKSYAKEHGDIECVIALSIVDRYTGANREVVK